MRALAFRRRLTIAKRFQSVFEISHNRAYNGFDGEINELFVSRRGLDVLAN